MTAGFAQCAPVFVLWGPQQQLFFNGLGQAMLGPAPHGWPGLIDALAPVAQRVLQSGQPEHTHAAHHSIVCTAVSDDAGQRVGVLCVALPPAAAPVEREEANGTHFSPPSLFNIVNKMPQLMWTARHDGFIEYANERWTQYTGLTLEQTLGTGWLTALHPEDIPHTSAAWSVALSRVLPIDVEYRLRRHDGVYRWYLARAAPIMAAPNEAPYWVGTLTDIDDQKNAFQDKTHAEHELKLAIVARDEFLSIASHELKTPITSLKLQLQMARRQIDPQRQRFLPPEKLVKVIDVSVRQIDRLTDLIADLLDVSKIQAGKVEYHFEVCDVGALVNEVVEQLSEQLENARCIIEVRVDGALSAQWDRPRVEQALVNLISNAIKYAPNAPVTVTATPHADRIELCVSDGGPGIPNDRQARIFERFERAVSSRNISGLGLGLYIVKQIALGHYGDVRVDSSPGHGTRFTLDLPTHPKAPA